jgi:preprotein translocase subunit SecF
MGRKRWFFAFSLLVTIPGLVFILLTPITGGNIGLKFSIDYTGGTLWEFKFVDPNVTPEQAKAVFVEQGLEDTTVVRTDGGYLLARTEPVGLRGADASAAPETSPAPSGSAGASGSPAASATTAPSSSAATSGSPAPSGSAATSGSPAPSGSAATSPSPTASVPAALVTAAPGQSLAPPSALPSVPPVAVPTVPQAGPLADVAQALEARYGPIEATRELTTIGPVISSELTTQAIILVLLGSLGIMAWMTFRFRNWKFGATALIALFHDVLVVVGVFAILGTFFGIEIDGLFITAMLTVIGFSVHDTIVVYDRIRENKARHAGEPFAEIVNHSILQTIGRSITTSFTVLITLLALLLFGGSATTYFVLALIIGISAGTYSSVFFAAPLLVAWQEWEDRRHGRVAAARTPRRAAS